MTTLGYAHGDEDGPITYSVYAVPEGTSYSDAVAEAQRTGARLVACDSILKRPGSDNSGSVLSGMAPVNLQGLSENLGLSCRPAQEFDFPA
ncbi:hypothetical protein [Nocardia sp. NBC_01388]|uniref:hypothetical protein n=1 Tax=Nocardia sp. NBC_01388 TaxID=2903596 RepID=UPI0032449F52